MGTPAAVTDEGSNWWPGLDQGFHERVAIIAGTPEGRRLHAWQQQQYSIQPGSTFPVGVPVLVRSGGELRDFVRAYHRCIETIVRERSGNRDVRQVVMLPEELEQDLERDEQPWGRRVHLCRLDLLPAPDGSFKVLETNANCPGGLLYAGRASKVWRELLLRWSVPLPDPLDHEHPEWMARWFLDVAEADTGVRPERVVLLRRDGGNRLELGDLVSIYEGLGVESWEADPRSCTVGASGEVSVAGRPVSHAYLKLGIQDFLTMRKELDPFVRAVGSGRLYVQNGLSGRWIGDNKLCLAVLSDPAFERLFEPADRSCIADRIPWSRNLGLCGTQEIERIRAARGDYVLKSPLDTRGRGVIVGREVSGAREWARKLEHGARRGWLVQEFCEAAEVVTDFGSAETHRHDVALGAINGEVQAGFMRSSGELRVNVARAGRMHPIFVADHPRPPSASA